MKRFGLVLFLLLVTSNSYAQGLSIKTLSPDSITSTSAVIRAMVNPQGLPATVYFTCGVLHDWIRVSSPLFYLSGSEGDTIISTKLTDLFPNASYDYRSFADNNQTTEEGGRNTVHTLSDSTARGCMISISAINTHLRYFRPLFFGVHTYATFCVNFELNEYILPPLPPAGESDFRFLHPGHEPGTCMDQGMNIDIRKYYTSTQIDTYRIHLQADPSNYPVTLSWSSPGLNYGGSVKMIDVYTGNLFSVDMKTQTSVTITPEFNELLIITQGPRNLIETNADSFSLSTVYLTGKYNPNGVPSKAWFEWGIVDGFTSSTDTMHLGNGFSPVEYSKQISGLNSDIIYFYRTVILTEEGILRSAEHSFTTMSLTAVEQSVQTPANFVLFQNYPNPFNPTTAIRYDLPMESFVTLKVYDVLGREVATLVHETEEAGTHSVNWNGENVPSGLYFYRIQTQGFHQTKKMFLLR